MVVIFLPGYKGLVERVESWKLALEPPGCVSIMT